MEVCDEPSATRRSPAITRGAPQSVLAGRRWTASARLPRDLSGGEQQRVAIARAVVNGAPLLLADEPTGCLDSVAGAEVMKLFLQLRDEGQTIFMVTHDPAIAAHADRVVRLRDGRLEAMS